jgi:hypothetical protein
VRQAAEHVSLDRKVPLQGKGNAIDHEQCDHIIGSALFEENVRLEQAEFQSPNRGACGSPRGEFLASLFRSSMSDIQVTVQIVTIDALKQAAGLWARGSAASRQTPGWQDGGQQDDPYG